MKVFYNKYFKGFYPVGTSAIVVAENQIEAMMMLSKELEDIGLRQTVNPDEMIELSDDEQVIILQNGDY